MKTLSIVFLFFISLGMSAQCSSTIEISNQLRKTKVASNGHLQEAEFFLDENDKYISSTYYSNLWMSAADLSGNPKLSAGTYRTENSTFVPGPLVDQAGSPMQNACEYFDRIWKIKGSDLANLKKMYYPGQLQLESIPRDILEWPAKGNPYFNIGSENGLKLDQELAPFWDENLDGTYDPMDGDLPVFHSEVNFSTRAEVWAPFVFAFSVYNDSGNEYFLGAEPLKMEMHQSIYMFHCEFDDAFNNTIFNNHSMLYKGDEVLTDFRLSYWDDSDLGCYDNDFIGCLPESNVSYTYNNSSGGEFCANTEPFPFNFGLVEATTILNHDLKSFLVYQSQFIGSPSPETTDPETVFQMINYQNGVWKDGTPMTQGETGFNPGSSDITLFMFPDLPNDLGGWSMINKDIPNRDFRSLRGIDVDGDLVPGQRINLNTASSVLMDRSVVYLGIFDGFAEEIERIKIKHNELIASDDGAFCGAMYCDENCVWPGDVYPDEIVNVKDLLYLGVVEGKGWSNGPARTIPTNLWGPFEGIMWTDELGIVNGRNADADGDGEITEKDYLTCEQNFGKKTYAYAPVVPVASFEDLNTGYKISFDKSTVSSTENIIGKVFNFSVDLADDSPGLEQGYHGISFEVVFDTSLVRYAEFNGEINTEYFENTAYARSFYDEYEAFNVLERIGDNRIQFVFTKNNGVNEFASGNLVEAFSLTLRTDASTTNLNGEEVIKLKIENSFIIDADGNPLEPIGYSSDELTLTDLGIVSSIDQVGLGVQIKVFPNPTKSMLYIESDLTVGGRLDLVDMNGKMVRSMTTRNLSENQVSVSDLAAGIYFLKIHGKGGTFIVSKKIVVLPE